MLVYGVRHSHELSAHYVSGSPLPTSAGRESRTALKDSITPDPLSLLTGRLNSATANRSSLIPPVQSDFLGICGYWHSHSPRLPCAHIHIAPRLAQRGWCGEKRR
jgi:hypothetical protein